MFNKIKNKINGFSGIEVLLAGSIMTLVMVSLLGLLFYSNDSMNKDNSNSQASLIMNQGLEAVSTIRDQGFDSLVDGVYGLLFSDGQWFFSGESDTVDKFTRAVTISTVSENVKKVAVAVNWFKSPGRLVGLSLYKYFTNWQEIENFDCERWFGDGEYFSYYQTICDKGDLILGKSDDLYEGLASNGNSLEFSLNSDYVYTEFTAADLNIDGNKPKTIELWAKTYSFTDSESLFAFGAPVSAGRDFSLRTLGVDNNWRLQLWGGYDIDFTYESLNKWVHFAIVHDGSRTNIYADGSLITGRDQILDTVSDEFFTIAWWPYWSLPNTFNGRIRELRVWDKALSQADILNNMSKQLVGNEANLVAYWPLDEGSGTEVIEKVSGLNSSLINSPVWTKDILNSNNFLSDGYRVSKVYNLDEHKNVVSSNISWLKETQDFQTALNFNGAPNYVEISDSENLNPINITLSAWIKWNIDPTTGSSWATIINKNGDSQYRLQHNSSNTAFEFGVRTVNGGRYVASTTVPQQGVWYFIVGTYDGSAIRIYVNGVLEGTSAIDGDLSTSTSNVNIGRRVSGDRYFNGQIDEVRIYNRALSSEEVLENMYQELKNPASNSSLIAYYKFNEEDGGIVFDDSKNLNNGTIFFSIPEPYREASQVFSKIDIYTAISNSNLVEPASYDLAENNSSIAGINIGDNLSGKYLWIKQDLETYNLQNTPRLKNLSFNIESDELVLSQADQLEIDASSGQVNPANRNQVNGINLSNSGLSDEIITIETIRPTWSGVNSNRRLSSVTIGGTIVWSGSAVSGSTLTLITPFNLDSSYGDYSLVFNFSRRVDSISLYSAFTMADTSSKQASMISGGVEDTTPPAAINDLNSVISDHESVTIFWTSPGNDGNSGLASYYEVRYSESVIDDSNWESASLLSNPPLPEIAGTVQSAKIDGLEIATSYYFAIKTFDENDNVSQLSNVLNQNTTVITDSSYLQIDMSGAVIGPSPLNNRNVSGILLDNNGLNDISIKSIGGAWTSRRVSEIFINGTSIWSGNLNSGGTVVLPTPYILTPGGGPYNLRLRFNNRFSGQTINYLDFTLFDDSVKRSDSKSF